MGKIRNKTVKTAARKIFRMYPDKIKPNFEENKVTIQGIAQIYSKKLRNQIAGYLVTFHKLSSKPRRIRVRKKVEEKPSETRRGRGSRGSRGSQGSRGSRGSRR